MKTNSEQLHADGVDVRVCRRDDALEFTDRTVDTYPSTRKDAGAEMGV